jgi:hypothetical protein
VVIATTAINLAIPVLAEKSSGQQGVDRADEAIHDNPNALEHADEGFHQGTCSGGFGAGGFPC